MHRQLKLILWVCPVSFIEKYMSSVSLTIHKKYRYFFYATLCVSWLTGTCFWILRNFAMVEGDFGPETHFLQFPALQLHGFAAFLMLMCLGALFSAHVPKTWKSKRARKSGISIMTFVCLSVLTAYSLYYLVNEDWHTLLGNGHALIGLISPLVLYIHVMLARKSRRAKSRKNKKIKSKSHSKKVSVSE